MTTATETICPPHQIFRLVAPIQRWGQSTSIGQSRKAFTFPSISSHICGTWLLEMPDVPSGTHKDPTQPDGGTSRQHPPNAAIVQA